MSDKIEKNMLYLFAKLLLSTQSPQLKIPNISRIRTVLIRIDSVLNALNTLTGDIEFLHSVEDQESVSERVSMISLQISTVPVRMCTTPNLGESNFAEKKNFFQTDFRPDKPLRCGRK
jgi:hypothetical protein